MVTYQKQDSYHFSDLGVFETQYNIDMDIIQDINSYIDRKKCKMGFLLSLLIIFFVKVIDVYKRVMHQLVGRTKILVICLNMSFTANKQHYPLRIFIVM